MDLQVDRAAEPPIDRQFSLTGLTTLFQGGEVYKGKTNGLLELVRPVARQVAFPSTPVT